MFSGLNLAMFSLSRMRLEIEATAGNSGAQKILHLRENSNFLLTTILWGNVGVNVILTLLSDSVLAGVFAFLFSTIVITLFGEIAPQAYFSRNALRVASALVPLIRFYQLVLYPVAKPTALILDKWLGAEDIQCFREHNLRELIKKHVDAPEADLDRLEGLGALNFLAIDDLPVVAEGEPLDQRGVLPVPFRDGAPVFPKYDADADDPFLSTVAASGKQWVVITDESGVPELALDSDAFLRRVLFRKEAVNPENYCHTPIVVASKSVQLGSVLGRLTVGSSRPGANVIKNDLILLWGEEKRVITGPDILGRLMQGIARQTRRPPDTLQTAPGIAQP
jgi:hypothetical protein